MSANQIYKAIIGQLYLVNPSSFAPAAYRMFDEVDEGTAIFKVKRENEVPVVEGGEGFKFVGIEEDLQSDHYLWLTGQAANWFHGEGSYTNRTPIR